MTKEDLLYDILTEVPHSRTITDIAQKTYMSQPYISQVIHSSEEKYGVKLINRNKLPISLTPAGIKIINDLAHIIEAQNKLAIDLAPLSQNNRSFIRIAFNQPWVMSIGSRITKELKQYYPDTKFLITEQTSNIAESKLETQETDIFTGKMFNNPQITSAYIYRQRLFFIIPKNSKLYQASPKSYLMSKNSLKLLDGEEFISLTDDSFFQKMIDHMFSDNSVKVKINIKVNNTLTATQMAIDGLGTTVSLFDTVKNRLLLNYEFNIVEIPKELLRLDLGVSTNVEASPYIKKIAKTIGNLMKNESHSNDKY